jgi:ribonuclease P protein component
MNEAHLSTQRTQTSENPWFSQADVDEGWTGRDPVTPGKRTSSAVGVTAERTRAPGRGATVGPLRSRRTLTALYQQGTRGRSGPVTVSFLTQPCWSRPEVAYAINKQVGTAVVRNRLRRRLRAIVAEQAASLPVGAYVVRTGPAGSSLGFDELKVAMNRAVEKATGGFGAHDREGPR